MNNGLIRTITVFTLFGILLLTLTLYSSPAMAEEEEATPIDMDTDDDGNGIPDEFETEFRVLLDSMLSMDAGLLNMGDIYQGDAYKALRGFYERLPIEAKTKQVLDAIPGLYQKLILDDALEKNPDALDELAAKEMEAIEDDEVYARAVEYIETITSDVAGADPGTSAKSGDTPPVSGQNQQSYGDLINQVGDILYRDTRSDRSIKDSFNLEYAMRWTHTGVYADNGFAYDADANNGRGCTGDGSGVALRSLGQYFQNNFSVRFSQLRTASGRASEDDAYLAARSIYGVACQTPFSLSGSKSDTSSFYCSKLTWRIYKDNATHPTDVDSNHPNYFAWLYTRYGGYAFYIILYIVAPDEIALDPDLDHYLTTRVVLSE